MKISIIIPVYNSSSTIKECLGAIYNSNFKNFETIIVSDNSKDDSIKIAKNFDCKIIELKENHGPAFARNKGAYEAEGDILLFIDSDVVISKNALSHLEKNFLNKDTNIIQGIYSHEPSYKSIAGQYQMSYNCYYIWPQNKLYTSSLSTCCCAIRKKIFIDNNGFNTNIKRASAEDEEFGYKLIQKGYKIMILRELNGEHRQEYKISKYIQRNFNRYTDIMKQYLRNKTYTTKIKQTNYLTVILGIPVMGLILVTGMMLIFFSSKINLYIFLLLNILFVFLHAGLFKFIVNTKGWIKAINSIPICYLDTFTMFSGAVYGFLGFIFGKKY